MKDKVFVDTNICIYCYSDDEFDKSESARELILNNNTYISIQVLKELTNLLIKKFKLDIKLIENIIKEQIDLNNIYLNNENDVLKAIEISNKYKFSFYDSLIISSAISSDTSILYSEDMQHNQIIEDKLKIINPFYRYYLIYSCFGEA